MRYLIDGYNLLHAMGVLGGRVGPTGLEKARLQLLGLLRGTFGDKAAEVTVVFDAAGAPRGAAEESTYRGIRVRYAVHQAEADDLIESLIRQDSAPGQLAVVSDDHRLQQAAHHRHCVVLSCEAFLQTVDQLRQARRQGVHEAPEKGALPGQEETQRWLREFADLENDPDWLELADPYGFGKFLRGEDEPFSEKADG